MVVARGFGTNLSTRKAKLLMVVEIWIGCISWLKCEMVVDEDA